ncbi:MAG: TonB-dependent receptor [Prevotellaceae bacterium]|jgi:TonB-linked SusC/RagA family outer membrane protein|nr:TonB-dependent receptor [Prevotellaceae bacterium]
MKKDKVFQQKMRPATLRQAAFGGAARVRIFLLVAALLVAPAALWAQNLNVSGTVRDGSGSPVAGVSVVVKGTTVGATTDVNGAYNIGAPANATLVFSFLGLATVEEAVGGRGRIDVTLGEADQAIDEVVVIGYGVQRREAVTGSVASIGGESMRAVQSTNFTQALQGRIAGVEMTQTSTKPGAAMQIRIRGTRSLNASNDPLIVLDGIPFAGTVNDIDPASIKSIDILKDASATAIYGSRGANGVIMISTNRGVAGQEAQVTYNGYYGVKSLFSRYPMMDGPKFAKLRADAAQTIKDLKSSTAPHTNSNDERDDVNTDWQDLFFRQGMVTSHDVSVAKGTEKGSYIFGGSFYKEQAVVPTQQYTRISLRTALDQSVGKYFRFGLTSNNAYGFSQGNQVGVGDALGNSPLADPYNADGTLKRANQVAASDIYRIWTKETLEDAKDLWMSDSKTLGSYNNLFGEVFIPGVEGLSYRVNLGLNIRFTNGGGFTGRGVTSATDPNAPSSASVSNSLTTSWAVENLLNYDRTFAGVHHVNAVAMYSAEQNFYNRSAFSVRDLPADHFQYYNIGYGEGEKTINKGDQQYSLTGLISYMGRVMYDYDDRYMVSLALRSDGSSRLASGHKWHTYPAVSAGWNLHRESFMGGLSWLSALKLRVGYGETSNQAIDPYKTLGLLNTRFYNFGDSESGYATGYYVSELPNVGLGWEYTQTWNFGADFSLLNKRLSGTIEYYRQHTKDILLSVDLPSTTAVPSYMANIGETENNGFELSLNGVILDNLNGFTWEAGVNFYANRNKLLSLASGEEKNEGNWWFVGYPIDVIFDYKKVGIWQEGDPYLDILEPGGNPGMIKVEYTGEYNPDGTPVRQIGADDRQPQSMEPDFQGGFNTRLAYRGFDLSVVGAFKSGGTLISTLHGATSYLNNLNGRAGNVDVDYWMPNNPGGKYPRPGGLTSADSPKYANTLAYFDASYLKIRAITLGYDFDRRWLKNVGLSRLRLYATVQNPLVLFSPFHSESGMDPETNSYGDENQSVTTQIQERLPIVGKNTPVTRNYLFGLSLTF